MNRQDFIARVTAIGGNMKKTISQNMIEILTLNGQKSVWYGDIKVIEECANKSNVQKGHPQKTIQCVLNALEYSKYFEKSYIISDHTGKKRKYRCFTIKS